MTADVFTITLLPIFASVDMTAPAATTTFRPSRSRRRDIARRMDRIHDFKTLVGYLSEILPSWVVISNRDDHAFTF